MRACGLDADALFREAGVDPAALRDPSARYPVQCMGRLWRLAAQRSDDPCFGLIAAAQWHPTTWHGLGYAWLASGNLEEALRRLVRYSAVLSTAVDVHLREVGDELEVKLEVHPSAPVEPLSVTIDAAVANVVHMCRMTYGPDFNPTRVRLSHDGVGCRRRRREFFRAPIEYGSGKTALYVDVEVARKPLSTANAELAHANEQVIRKYLSDVGGSAIVLRIKAFLIDALSSGTTTEKDVADWLHMSVRNLQRTLRDEGTTYKEVLEETRRQLAKRFIQDHTLTLNEITYLLGFSELSSFSRSFKCWTGVPPSAYREMTRHSTSQTG